RRGIARKACFNLRQPTKKAKGSRRRPLTRRLEPKRTFAAQVHRNPGLRGKRQKFPPPLRAAGLDVVRTRRWALGRWAFGLWPSTLVLNPDRSFSLEVV